MDPVLVNAGANVLGKVLAPSPAGPSSADSVFSTNLGFDNSGWNVNFGSGTQSSVADKTSSQGGAGGVSGNLNSYLPWAIVLVGALVAYKMFKK